MVTCGSGGLKEMVPIDVISLLFITSEKQQHITLREEDLKLGSLVMQA